MSHKRLLIMADYGTPNQSVNLILFRFNVHYRKLPPMVPMDQNVSTESMFEGLATEV